MSDKSAKNKTLSQKLKTPYRFVVLDDDTLAEKKTARCTLSGVFWALLGVILSVMALTYVLVAFTPIKHLIPGYAEITNNKVYMDLNERIENLESELDAQAVYTNGLKNILNPSQVKLDNLDENLDFVKNNAQNQSKNNKLSNSISLDDYYFYTPLKGEISAPFDLEGKHFGVDIVAEENSAVKSILDGVVIFSDWSAKNGNTISVQHRNNLITVYKHNSKLLKKIGQFVKKGEAICIIGNTGKLTSGPHVHFELWNNGIAIDPDQYINFE